MANDQFGGEFGPGLEAPPQESPPRLSFRGRLFLARCLVVILMSIGVAIYEFAIVPSISSVTFVDRLVWAQDLEEANKAEKRLLERDRSRFRGDQQLVTRIPQLISLLGVRNQRGVMHVLAGIGRPAIQPMIAALDAPASPVALGRLPENDDAVKSLQLECLFDTFSLLHAEAPEAASRVARFLGHPDLLVCDKCVDTLVVFGGDAVQPLAAILDDPRAAQRTKRYAVVALSRIGSRMTEAVPVLRKRFAQTTDPEERKLIESALKNAQGRP
jgi:hypothetical protein